MAPTQAGAFRFVGLRALPRQSAPRKSGPARSSSERSRSARSGAPQAAIRVRPLRRRGPRRAQPRARGRAARSAQAPRRKHLVSDKRRGASISRLLSAVARASRVRRWGLGPAACARARRSSGAWPRIFPAASGVTPDRAGQQRPAAVDHRCRRRPRAFKGVARCDVSGLPRPWPSAPGSSG
jgi:hypothetical protein